MTRNEVLLAEIKQYAESLDAKFEELSASIHKAGGESKMARVHELYKALDTLRYLEPKGWGDSSVMADMIADYFIQVLKICKASWTEELYYLKRDEQVMELYKNQQLANWHSWDKKPEKEVSNDE